MELCSDGHDEVCYDSTYCPVCELISETDGKIEDLTDKVELLENELKEKQKEVDDMDS